MGWQALLFSIMNMAIKWNSGIELDQDLFISVKISIHYADISQGYRLDIPLPKTNTG